MKPETLGENVLGPSASIRDAMAALDTSSLEIILVVENERVLGVMTDGDIRRALLGGQTLESPIAHSMQRNFKAVAPSAGRAEVLEMMTALRLKQVPMLDRDGRLVGLHLLHDLLGTSLRPNWAVVVAGGWFPSTSFM